MKLRLILIAAVGFVVVGLSPGGVALAASPAPVPLSATADILKDLAGKAQRKEVYYPTPRAQLPPAPEWLTSSVNTLEIFQRRSYREVVYPAVRAVIPKDFEFLTGTAHNLARVLLTLWPNLTTLRNDVAGYPDKTAVAPGAPLKMFLSVRSGSNFGAKIAVTAHSVIEATQNKLVRFARYDAPLDVPASPCRSHKGAGCEYPASVEIETKGLPFGTYYVVFESLGQVVSEQVYFIVRPAPKDAGRNRVAVVYPEFTWQAYNAIGGSSFYDNLPADRHLEISLLRPVRTALTNDFHSARGTVPFSRELRRLGIEPLELTNQDLNDHRDYVQAIDLLILTGHDEYWTGNMRDFVEDLLRAGRSVAIFSGNVSWWKLNIRDDRLFLNQSPKDSERPDFRGTGYWFEPWIKREIVPVFGLTYLAGGVPVGTKLALDAARAKGLSTEDYRRSRGIRVADPSHPIFAGTGLKRGDYFGERALLVDIEQDSVLLRGDGAIDNSTTIKFPSSLRVLGTGFLIDPSAGSSDGFWGNRLLHSGLIAELDPTIGGRVLHFGSIGWFGAIDARDPHALRIFENTLKYLRVEK